MQTPESKRPPTKDYPFADERDRQREKEEIDDIRRKLLEQGDDDVDTKIARVRLQLRYMYMYGEVTL